MNARLRWAKAIASATVFAALLVTSALPARATPDEWRTQGWNKTDFHKRSIDWAEIQEGGPPKDGIPPIDDPKFIPIRQEKRISATEPVIGLAIGSDARAYPIRILMWHEIVNDVVGGVPVTVTYCPLCNAAIVFDARIDGIPHTFGTTGKLRNSDLVMYDRRTESWWQQFTGEAVTGALTGRTLRSLPARLETFAEFSARFPEGRVLVPNDPSKRSYGRNPYQGYDTTAVPFLYRGPVPSGLPAMARVVVVREGAAARAITLDLLRKYRRIVWGVHVLTWSDGQVSALDAGDIAAGRPVGSVVVQRMQAGSVEDVAYDVTFAFVFHAFNPSVRIIDACSSEAVPSASLESGCKLEIR